MSYFLAKTEPGTYSIIDLKRDDVTVWDGVHNYQAILNIKKMRVGDEVFIYHSMKDKKIVGIARVVSEPFLNSEDKRYSWAVKLKYIRTISGPSLADFKQENAFKSFLLVTHSRLSVMEVPDNIASWILNRIESSS